jgi:hypothetical protein
MKLLDNTSCRRQVHTSYDTGNGLFVASHAAAGSLDLAAHEINRLRQQVNECRLESSAHLGLDCCVQGRVTGVGGFECILALSNNLQKTM